MNNKEYTFEEQLSRMTRLLLRERLRGAWAHDGQDAWRKRLLRLIKEHPHMTVHELAELIDRRMPGGEELLLGLEKKGYITLKPGEGAGDRIVELTELGQKEAAEIPEFTEVFRILSDEERETMRGYMTRIIEELEKRVKADDKSCSHLEDRTADSWEMGDLSGFDHMRKLHDCFKAWKGMRGPFSDCQGLRGYFGDYGNRGI